MTKRVYHPTLDTWQDVPDGDVDSWADAGWRKTAPKHVDTTDLPEVGTHPGIASLPPLVDDTPAPTPTTSRAGTTRTTASRTGSTTTTGGTTAGTTT